MASLDILNNELRLSVNCTCFSMLNAHFRHQKRDSFLRRLKCTRVFHLMCQHPHFSHIMCDLGKAETVLFDLKIIFSCKMYRRYFLKSALLLLTTPYGRNRYIPRRADDTAVSSIETREPTEGGRLAPVVVLVIDPEKRQGGAEALHTADSGQ